MSTMTKAQVMEEINSKRDTWLDSGSYSVNQIGSVSLKDSGIYVNEMPLSERAISKMLYRMQLTNKFIDYKSEVGTNDFSSVFNNIIAWNRGKQIVTKSNGSVVSDIFFYRGEEEFNPNNRLSMIVDGIYDKLSGMNDDIEIHKFDMDVQSKNIRFSTVDPTTKFNAVGSDEWVLGSILSIGLAEAFASPYYGRLICTNGMVDGIKMRKASISGKGYTEAAISQIISKGTNLKKLAGDHIKEVSAAAVNCEVSLSEYLTFRKIMLNGLSEEQKEHADLLFPLHHIEDAYGGKEIFENSDQWKRTAKSGVKVYELLNDITKWTTHNKSINNPTMKNRLNEKASTWFMKAEWDNKNVAPNVELKRPPCFNDSIALI